MFNKSEKIKDKSDSLKQRIEELVDHVAQFIIIDESLSNTIFSLLIDNQKSNSFSFLSAVNTAVEFHECAKNHPLVCKNLQASSWQELSDLHKLFYADKSIHETYEVNSDLKVFIQWAFYNYLHHEYKIEIPKSITLDKPPLIESNQPVGIKAFLLPYKPLIANDEMATLIFMLQDSEITTEDKQRIADRICKANKTHNTTWSKLITPDNKPKKHNQASDTTFFKPHFTTLHANEEVCALTDFELKKQKHINDNRF